jgi:3-hydroxyisobutyrate dehydrogenase-like beta-hydroxyacid dehydrogenase
MKVGFIGLGAMGAAMASNLIAAGHQVTVWNRSEGAAQKLESLGAKVARTPERAAQGDVLAAAGKLNMLVAGDQAAIEKVRPLLETMAARLWPMGDAPERANVVKLAGNFMIVSAIESLAEASVLARAYGVEAADFIALMTGTLFASPVYQVYGNAMAEQRFTPPGFALPLGLKDVLLAQDAAHAQQVPMPLAGVLRESLIQALAEGAQDLDLAALALVSARRANLESRK